MFKTWWVKRGIFFVFCFIWFLGDRVSLNSPDCPGTHSVDQAGLELRNLPASASQNAGITGMCYHCPAKRNLYHD